MPYGCSLEDLLNVLHERAPAKVEALAADRRSVERGMLSVGLKLHYVGDGNEFGPLVERLGGSPRVLELNVFRHAKASMCMVLPPVGSARAAILLLECIERFTGCRLFGDPRVQIQVCSPGRINADRSALLAIGFYLGSDTLRRYAMGDFETTVSNDIHYRRGQRLVIYDAGGDFDRSFDWWERGSNGRERVVRKALPFVNGRTDLLAGNGSRLDVENINLLASLLVHAEHKGYWESLGNDFQGDMLALLDRHLLSGLVKAPWVRAGPERAGDVRFFNALQELVACAFDESARVRKKRSGFSRLRAMAAAPPPDGILFEMQALLQKYRAAVALASSGGRT